MATHRVFIGHGRSNLWLVLKDFLQNQLHAEVEEFNAEPVAGISTTERLSKMLDSSTFAFLIMTAEDKHADGTDHARENVIHEVGLFQGRLGFRKAIVLLEEGCQEFSNIHGLTQIKFPKGDILARSEEVRKVLAREDAVPSPARVASPNVTKPSMIFDGTVGELGLSLVGKCEKIHDQHGHAIGEKAAGTVKFDHSTITISRSNTSGRYVIELLRYLAGERTFESMPPNELATGKRAIKLSCEVKCPSGAHTLRFVIKETSTAGAWLGDYIVRVEENEWKAVDYYFHVDPARKWKFRIDDIDVSHPGTVQIRNLILREVL